MALIMPAEARQVKLDDPGPDSCWSDGDANLPPSPRIFPLLMLPLKPINAATPSSHYCVGLSVLQIDTQKVGPACMANIAPFSKSHLVPENAPILCMRTTVHASPTYSVD